MPSLLLQPLIENAVRYGVGRHTGDCTIAITAAQVSNKLCIEVRDQASEPSSPSEEVGGHGVGLANTRERLSQLYGAAAKLDVMPCSGGWTSRVELPFRLAPPTIA